jgi:hypothetical protein
MMVINQALDPVRAQNIVVMTPFINEWSDFCDTKYRNRDLWGENCWISEYFFKINVKISVN